MYQRRVVVLAMVTLVARADAEPRPPQPQPKQAAAPKVGCPSNMVHVRSGSFVMGSPEGEGDDDEHPQHKVTLSAYCIDKTEVTVAAYHKCVVAGACQAAPLEVNWGELSEDEKRIYDKFCNGNRTDRRTHPVNCVDWDQARAYCTWAQRRMPTEAEWEYAARGTDGRKHPWGNDAPDAMKLNACGRECREFFKRLNMPKTSMHDEDDGWVSTAPAGSYPAGTSPFGAVDMAGNVREWTADWGGDYPSNAQKNPIGPSAGTFRKVRGGGYDDSEVGNVRTAFRDGSAQSLRNFDIGFRCARGN